VATQLVLSRPGSQRGALWAAYIPAVLWTGAVGVSRVAAGKHRWDDVSVGALLGAGIGVGLPVLHDALRKKKHRR